MKFITIKKILALLIVTCILTERTLQFSSNANENRNMRRTKSQTKNKSGNKLKREKTSTSTSTKTKHPILLAYFAIPVIYGIFDNVQKIAAEDEALNELKIEVENRQLFLLEILDEKPEIEQQFKAKVVRKIATFLSFFGDDFFKKEEMRKRAVLKEHINCYLEKELQIPDNRNDPNFISAELDTTTKFITQTNEITFSGKNDKVKLLTFSGSIDNMRKQFVSEELPKFMNIDNANLRSLRTKTNPRNKLLYGDAFVKFAANIEELNGQIPDRETTNSEISTMKRNDKPGVSNLQTKLYHGLEMMQQVAYKANLISSNIVNVADNLKTLISFVKNPFKSKPLGKEIKEVREIMEKIEKYGKTNAESLKKVKDFVDKHKTKFEDIRDKSGKIIDKTQACKEILEGVASLQIPDRPAMELAKVLIIAANVSRLIPGKNPVKATWENIMDNSAQFILDSEALQATLDAGITRQTEDILKMTDKGMIPPMAFNSFADGETAPRLADHHISEVRESVQKIVKTALNEQGTEFYKYAARGEFYHTASAYSDNATGDELSRHRTEDVMAEMSGYMKNAKESASKFFSRGSSNSDSSDSTSGSDDNDSGKSGGGVSGSNSGSGSGSSGGSGTESPAQTGYSRAATQSDWDNAYNYGLEGGAR